MIYVKRCGAWHESRGRLLQHLKDYHNAKNPVIILNFNNNYEGDEDKIVLNRKVDNMRNKLKMNKLLDELNILHPKTYYKKNRKFPRFSKKECVLKPKYGERGCGITFTTFNKIKKKDFGYNYVQEYIPFEKEYRVLINFMRIFGIKEKVGKAKLKNSRTCTFKKIYRDGFLEVYCESAFRKLKFHGIDFTGMDVGLYKGNYYIIELNSAPSLSTEFSKELACDLIGLLYR